MLSNAARAHKVKSPKGKNADLPPRLSNTPKTQPVEDDDDDDDSDLEGVAPSKPASPPPPGRFEGSRFQSKFDKRDNVYTAKVIPVWCEWVCTSSNEVRVLAQIAFTFSEGGSRLHVESGYKWTYQRHKKLAKELPPMTVKQVEYAVQQLISRGIIVVGSWRENNRMLRIDADVVAKLVNEYESKNGS
jgi:hypothetical protein